MAKAKAAPINTDTPASRKSSDGVKLTTPSGAPAKVRKLIEQLPGGLTKVTYVLEEKGKSE